MIKAGFTIFSLSKDNAILYGRTFNIPTELKLLLFIVWVRCLSVKCVNKAGDLILEESHSRHKSLDSRKLLQNLNVETHFKYLFQDFSFKFV
jgi:hypothetical protein